MKNIIAILFYACFLTAPSLHAEQKAYPPGKVVYDLTSPETYALRNVLDRAGLLQKMYGNDPFESSIIIVIHGDAIPLFAKNRKSGLKELMNRAHGLAMGEVIQFRLCAASARMQGFRKEDFHEFITLVPMADAEIVQLQHKGHAYMH